MNIKPTHHNIFQPQTPPTTTATQEKNMKNINKILWKLNFFFHFILPTIIFCTSQQQLEPPRQKKQNSTKEKQIKCLQFNGKSIHIHRHIRTTNVYNICYENCFGCCCRCCLSVGCIVFSFFPFDGIIICLRMCGLYVAEAEEHHQHQQQQSPCV